jgi:SAM-dependent methyltransferase
MTHEVLVPAELEADDALVAVRDSTAPDGLVFVHGEAAKPLATPWQVAAERAAMINPERLPSGAVLDVACGSGVQLAALAAILERPAIGIELDPSRARASAANLRTVAAWFGALDAPWFLHSRVLVGDGTAAEDVLRALEGPPVGLLQLDPARPRNSRTHDLEEMAPSPSAVLSAWAPHLARGPDGQAVLLDLSPRLTHDQRLAVEAVVDTHLPGVQRTWVWGSRGGGRVDRLSAWLGGASTPDVARRFVRYPADGSLPLTIEGGRALPLGEDLPQQVRRPPRRGEQVSLIDSALLASGLVEPWLRRHLGDEASLAWTAVDGRRPQVHHDAPLLLASNERGLVQASGRVAAVVHQAPDEGNVDDLVALALEHDVARLTLRCTLPADLQPKLQGSLDRQLSRRHGRRQAFLCHAGQGPEVHLLCVDAAVQEGPR